MRNGKYMKNTHQKPLSLSKMVEQTWRCRGENLGQLNGPVDFLEIMANLRYVSSRHCFAL